MRRLHKLLIAGAALGMLGGLAPLALAHDTGHESRTVADCEKLPGTAAAGERAQCLACVHRPEKHHLSPGLSAREPLPPR